MKKIEFVMNVRDCPHNNTAEGKGRKRIIDWDVVIDGSKVAQFEQWNPGARLYTLFDTNREVIKEPKFPGHRTPDSVQVKSRVLFEATIKRLLAAKLIPSLDAQIKRCKEKAAAREQAEKDTAARHKREAFEARLIANGDEILGALETCVRANENMRQGTFRGAAARAARLLAVLRNETPAGQTASTDGTEAPPRAG